MCPYTFVTENRKTCNIILIFFGIECMHVGILCICSIKCKKACFWTENVWCIMSNDQVVNPIFPTCLQLKLHCNLATFLGISLFSINFLSRNVYF